MRLLLEWLHRLASVFRPGRRDDDLAEELRLHQELAAEQGRAARVKAGPTLQAMEGLRDQRGVPWLDDLARDMRHALRSLRRTPGFSAVALLTLALGIGATTAVFTVVRSVLLRPLPFPEPDALHVISYTWPGPAWLYPGMSDPGYLQFREASRTFDSLATFSQAQSTLTGAGDAIRIPGAAVTIDFFRVLGVNAARGRTFGADDDQPGSDQVVVIGDGLWRRQFGADPSLVNRTIALNGMPYRVAGIVPPGFSYPADADYWIPLRVRINPNLGNVRPVIGRVKAGVTTEQAQADLDAWVRTLPPDPNPSRNLVAQVTPLHDAMVRDVRLPLLVFSGAVGLVLVIACANVANLLLMRAVSRRHEIAARLALGASRSRVVRQFLTEGALLSLAGGCVGAAVAILAGRPLLSLVPAGRLPSDMTVRVDGWVFAFAGGLAVLTGLAAGVAPIVQMSRKSLAGALREGASSATRRSRRLRHAVVIAEVALTLVLLVGAGLLVRSFIGLRSVPLGFIPERVMTMTVDLPVSRYPGAEQAAMLHARLLQSLSAIPGVESAAAVNWLPLGDLMLSGDVQAEDRPELAGKYNATKVAVSPGYFATIGVRLLRGRPFSDADRPGQPPVAVVSESVARRFWPGGDPLGKRIALVERPKAEHWLTVVGVVEDVRQDPFRLAPTEAVYQPYAQVTNRFFVGYMTFLVRTSGDPAQAAPMMRAALARIDPNEAPQAVMTLDAVIDRTVAEPRFQARALTVFSIAALLLAAIGLYGVLASSVLERRSEIGIRMALGADGTSVVRMIARHTLLLCGVGIAIGLAGSLAAADVLESLLFNVAPTDALTFAIAVGVLLSAAVAAAVVPARRAARLDPITVLRAE
jgi:putative ABC transport system permease protein